MKPWYKSRTLWFNVFVAVLGLVAGMVDQLRPLFTSPAAFTAFSLIVAAVNVVLRVVTTAALGEQQAKT